jgi:hypothetical protein
MLRLPVQISTNLQNKYKTKYIKLKIIKQNFFVVIEEIDDFALQSSTKLITRLPTNECSYIYFAFILTTIIGNCSCKIY